MASIQFENDATNYLEIDEPLWIAYLSNGKVVNHQNWLELKKYCEQERLYIYNLILRFRSNIVHPFPENQDGYFFTKKFIQGFGGTCLDNFIVGAVKNSFIITKEYTLPALELAESSMRTLKDNEHKTITKKLSGLY